MGNVITSQPGKSPEKTDGMSSPRTKGTFPELPGPPVRVNCEMKEKGKDLKTCYPLVGKMGGQVGEAGAGNQSAPYKRVK
jgi:hypothetical protein